MGFLEVVASSPAIDDSTFSITSSAASFSRAAASFSRRLILAGPFLGPPRGETSCSERT
mgnify:CR=1 FL=1